jgi:uncharacterized protein YkwD
MKRISAGLLFAIVFTLLGGGIFAPAHSVTAQAGTDSGQPTPAPATQTGDDQAGTTASTTTWPSLFLPVVTHLEDPPTIAACAPSSYEGQLATLMINDPDQQRASLRCDPILAQEARRKAKDMAERGYFNHVDPDGYGPNYYVVQAGYSLPDFYDQNNDANNIESIAAGFSTPSQAWFSLTNSPSHRPHVLGTDPFFRDQVDYGIGFYEKPGSRYQWYWVILTARH